jgi:polyhydroxybutyrate depolymerase
MLRKVITLALALIAGFAVLAGSGRAMAQTTLHTLEHAGQQRTYHLTVPASYDSVHPAPLLIALHPFGSSGRAMEPDRPRSGRRGSRFLVAYPDSLDLTWNDGRPEVDDSLLYFSGRDDLGFVSALLDELADDYSLDPDRVMLAGFGSGGLLAYRLACEQPEVFSRVAVVSALPGATSPAFARPDGPRNLFIALGSADPSYPAGGRWTGDSSGDDLMRTMSLTETSRSGRNAPDATPKRCRQAGSRAIRTARWTIAGPSSMKRGWAQAGPAWATTPSTPSDST